MTKHNGPRWCSRRSCCRWRKWRMRCLTLRGREKMLWKDILEMDRQGVDAQRSWHVRRDWAMLFMWTRLKYIQIAPLSLKRRRKGTFRSRSKTESVWSMFTTLTTSSMAPKTSTWLPISERTTTESKNKKINNGILCWPIAKELLKSCKTKLPSENIC